MRKHLSEIIRMPNTCPDNEYVFSINTGCAPFISLFFVQAYNLSRDHKPELEVERERILKAGGFIHAGRVNGSLNLARAIGTNILQCVLIVKGTILAWQ